VAIASVLSLAIAVNGADLRLDQQYLPHVTLEYQTSADGYFGQSFTVGLPGILRRVEIQAYREGGFAGTLKFYLVRLNGPAIDQVLAEVDVAT